MVSCSMIRLSYIIAGNIRQGRTSGTQWHPWQKKCRPDQWSEVQQDCIRVFEKGIRMKAVDGSQSAFIVFSPDSTQVELFFSSGDKNEILDRRSLPSGGYAWNVEDDDTKNVRRINGKWTISQRGKTIYSQEEFQNK